MLALWHLAVKTLTVVAKIVPQKNTFHLVPIHTMHLHVSLAYYKRVPQSGIRTYVIDSHYAHCGGMRCRARGNNRPVAFFPVHPAVHFAANRIVCIMLINSIGIYSVYGCFSEIT